MKHGKKSPKYDAFFAYAEDYLIQIKLEDAEIIAAEKFSTEWGIHTNHSALIYINSN